jgi:inner membrane protein
MDEFHGGLDFAGNSSKVHTGFSRLGHDAGMDLPPPLPSSNERASAARGSIVVKLVAIGVLVLVLQVPLLFVRSTLDERQARRGEAVQDIASTWGEEQCVAGPFLVVPYTFPSRTQPEVLADGRMVKTDEIRGMKGAAWFLPSELGLDGEMEPSERYRGIFKTTVYAARLALRGVFRPQTEVLGLERAVYDWQHARVVVGVADPRGLRAAPRWQQAGADRAFVPAAPREGWLPLVEVALPLEGPEEAQREFSIEIALQGTARLSFVPVGADNRATLRAAWADPSFDGRCLPAAREVGPEGFKATWETAYFGRGFPQQWAEHPGREGVRGAVVSDAAIGVTLANPVDAYRLVERSLKYALLFLVLVFAVFFLFEATGATPVHPVQYTMIGGALVLFYLGFLALGEFLGTGWAYAAAAGASTVLVTGYALAVLRAGSRTAVIGVGVAGTYGYLYFILQLQDYALLAGTAALFALLAAAMWITRRLDWARLGSDRRTRTSE